MKDRFEAEQLQMPLLVPIWGQPIASRFDAFETEMLERIKQKSGLSKSDIIRRAVRLVRVEVAKHGGSADFLLNPDHLHFPSTARAPRSGRKSRSRKISDLEKTIREHLRAAESQQRELAALREREQIKGAA